ncbi:MFS transporter [Sphingomonas sp.]|uniref:spinster family MFS transporter n=1 Tax=Sphingomonas sp. TaxID=28214 RepID=UPI002E364707|nr:MFS transporter [Sphingomonas sp.]HEX4694762.1 MFS transporter [Sphingomonas sp.]
MSGPTDLPEVQATFVAERRALTLLLLTFAYFFSYMDRQILAILNEDIVKDLHLGDEQLGLLNGTAFAIFYAGLGLPIAWLADRSNRVRIIAIALTIWSGFTALGGLAMSFWQLLGARIGVGIGEAGSSPPSHSIIADLYPPEKRASAMSIYSLGVGLGAAFGTIIGGVVATYYGWRVALYVIGLPGLLLAVTIWLVVPEPKRGLSDAQIAMDEGSKPTFAEGFASLFSNRAALHLIVGFTLTSMIGYGLTAFGPSYMQRSFGFTKLDIALKVAPAGAVIVGVAAIASGRLADWLTRRYGLYAQSLMVAVLKTCGLPLTICFYLSTSGNVAIGFFFASILFSTAYLGVTFALIQSEAPIRQRAMWAAITLLVNNMIGLGLGPLAVGAISEALKPTYGAESLRYAMFTFAAITPWAIFHYWRAGVLLKRRAA